jgi:hypothetical protein
VDSSWEKTPPNKITTPIINELRLHTTTLIVKLRKAPELKESYHYARTKLGETDGRGNNVPVLLRLPENTIMPKHYSMKTKVERVYKIYFYYTCFYPQNKHPVGLVT